RHGGSSLDRDEEQDPCLHGSSVEGDKEEYSFAHQDGKRPRKGPLFGGARLTIEHGSDFLIDVTSFLFSPDYHSGLLSVMPAQVSSQPRSTFRPRPLQGHWQSCG